MMNFTIILMKRNDHDNFAYVFLMYQNHQILYRIIYIILFLQGNHMIQ